MSGGKTGFTRRELGLLSANVAVATMAGGTLYPSAARAQQAKAVLGHFGSANPQTFGKATGAFQKGFGDRAATEFVTVSAGPQIVAAMAGNSMDMCNIGSSPMVVAFANNLKMSMVYVEKYITDSECLAVRTDAGIGSLKDLKGKKIGLPFNTSVHFSMLAALDTVGMKASDVTLINLKPDSILATWKRKDIDATFIWHPVLADCLADSGKLLFTTGDLVSKGILVFDGIIVRNEFKEKYPHLVLSYLKTYDEICTMYEKNPQGVIDIIGPYLNMKPELAAEYIKTFHSVSPKEMATDKWMGLPGAKETGVTRTIVKQAEFLKSQDQLKEIPPSFAPFIDQSFLAKMV
jgi:taurine transport system substrate-binding protein